MIDQLAGMLVGVAIFALAVRALTGAWPWQLHRKK
jgi:hypothetical protein